MPCLHWHANLNCSERRLAHGRCCALAVGRSSQAEPKEATESVILWSSVFSLDRCLVIKHNSEPSANPWTLVLVSEVGSLSHADLAEPLCTKLLLFHGTVLKVAPLVNPPRLNQNFHGKEKSKVKPAFSFKGSRSSASSRFWNTESSGKDSLFQTNPGTHAILSMCIRSTAPRSEANDTAAVLD